MWIAGDADYPIADPLPDLPAVLFGEGDAPEALAAPRVAIVGTRSATPHGLADARELGAFLAAAGVTVVSGLAIGIDGAAHEGALDAGGAAIGVVATGLDVVYPRRHNVLTQRVRGRGLLLTEYPFGVQPHRAQFPERNRIIAAAADVCVVVEATATGGARITAEDAVRYGRDVFALPGARRNPAASGCNQLIADGAQVLLDPGDLLIALGRGPRRRVLAGRRPSPRRSPTTNGYWRPSAARRRAPTTSSSAPAWPPTGWPERFAGSDRRAGSSKSGAAGGRAELAAPSNAPAPQQ